MKLKNKTLRAFTLIESLLTLAISCFMVIMLSGSVNHIFQSVDETLFFLSFENLYRDTQKLSSIKQESQTLQISQDAISNGITSVKIPKTVSVDKSYQLVFDKDGGNSSLAKIQFHTETQAIDYQLYIGSGNYKKTETKSVYTP